MLRKNRLTGLEKYSFALRLVPSWSACLLAGLLLPSSPTIKHNKKKIFISSLTSVTHTKNIPFYFPELLRNLEVQSSKPPGKFGIS